MAYGIVTADYVLARLETMPIVDVRPAPYYEESRIPYALSVPMLAVKELGGDVAAEMDLPASKLQLLQERAPGREFLRAE